MSLAKLRTAIYAQGLGTLLIREKSPSSDSYLSDVGYLSESSVEDNRQSEEIMAETGDLVNVVERSENATFTHVLMQTGIDEINLPKDSGSKVYAAIYAGLLRRGGTAFQVWIIPNAKIVAGVTLKFANGLRSLPVAVKALKDLSLAYDVPNYHVLERDAEMRLNHLQLWIEPEESLNSETAKILDLSGFDRHGDVSSDYTTIWTAGTDPAYMLRFDGTDDYVSFGNILNDDASTDFMLEAWVKFPSGGAQEEIICKKAQVSDDLAGWALHKTAADLIAFKLADGDSNATATTAGTVTTTWKHVAAVVDRGGNMQMYLNGAASGSPATVSGQTTATNSHNLYIGRDNTAYGQVDVGGVRFHKFASGVPSDIATVVLNHYNADKAVYGL